MEEVTNISSYEEIVNSAVNAIYNSLMEKGDKPQKLLKHHTVPVVGSGPKGPTANVYYLEYKRTRPEYKIPTKTEILSDINVFLLSCGINYKSAEEVTIDGVKSLTYALSNFISRTVTRTVDTDNTKVTYFTYYNPVRARFAHTSLEYGQSKSFIMQGSIEDLYTQVRTANSIETMTDQLEFSVSSTSSSSSSSSCSSSCSSSSCSSCSFVIYMLS